jgi:hypothetical protein
MMEHLYAIVVGLIDFVKGEYNMFMQGDKVRVVQGRRSRSLGTKVGNVIHKVFGEKDVYVVGFVGEHGEPDKHAYVCAEADMSRATKFEIERAERLAEEAAMASVKRKEKESENK